MTGDIRLGDWIVRPLLRTIELGDQTVQVKPKSMAVLECLAAAQGEPVTRSELLDTVWPGADVSDDVLTKSIVELRQAFGDSAREPRVIETIPRLGFRLLLPPETPQPQLANPKNAPPRQRGDGPARWRRVGLVGLLLAVFLLVTTVWLSNTGTRLWLSETGTNLFLKAAGFLSSRSFEQRPGIAVLPLVNFSGDPENEYFSDGMSVEIINRLGRANRLPVIARSSTFEFKERYRDVREIGRLLGVTHVLEGSVRKAGQDIRLTVQLIDTRSGAHVWSGIYQRELSDVFDVQRDIARNIVEQIGQALGDDSGLVPGQDQAVSFMEVRQPSSLEAYELYLKGVEMVTSTRPALIQQAAAYFDRAIALEGDYADAWAAKGYAIGVLGAADSGSGRIPASVYPEAIAAFDRALEIEPRHAFATGWLGVLLMLNDFKWAEGMELLRRSLELNPNNASLLAVYGFYLDTLQMEGAGEVLERAYRLDPFGIEAIMDLAIHLQRKGRLLDAASLVENTLIVDREGYSPNYFSAAFNIWLGRLDVAEERIRKARLVAGPRDLNLDSMQWLIDNRRGKGPLPMAEIQERRLNEPLHGLLIWDGWNDLRAIEEYGLDAEAIVAAFELAIEQRHPALRTVLFRAKPALMPEQDWRRFREITGVAQFQQSRRN